MKPPPPPCAVLLVNIHGYLWQYDFVEGWRTYNIMPHMLLWPSRKNGTLKQDFGGIHHGCHLHHPQALTSLMSFMFTIPSHDSFMAARLSHMSTTSIRLLVFSSRQLNWLIQVSKKKRRKQKIGLSYGGFLKWRCPQSSRIFHFKPSNWRYPHDYGNPHSCSMFSHWELEWPSWSIPL